MGLGEPSTRLFIPALSVDERRHGLQVGRVTAPPMEACQSSSTSGVSVMAGVIDIVAGWDRAMRQRVDQAMSQALATLRHLGISTVGQPPCPRPALIGLTPVDAVPKSYHEWNL
jgi:hypothetical protein